MATKTTTYTNVKGLNKALAKLPKEASAELRTAAKAIAAEIAQEAQGRARGQGGVAALIAPSIKAARDRVPVVRMGGSGKLEAMWGAEFGGRGRPTTQQFLPHRGQAGYFLWPTVRDRSDWMQDRYSEALDDALGDIR